MGQRSKNSSAGQFILFQVAGESFATVGAAIRSNTCSQCYITLVLERPGGSAQ